CRPADVHVNGVLQRGTLAHELVVLLHEVDEVPVDAGIEPGSEAGRDIRGEHRVAEEDRVDSLVSNELCDHVDARLRQRRLELRVVCDVDLRRADRPGGLADRAHTRSDHDSGDVAGAESRGLREHTERALQKLVAVVLEKDKRVHTSRFSARKSKIACAALPSSSTIFVESPRAGGSLSAYTSVR